MKNKLKALRKQSNKAVKDMANALNVSIRYIKNYPKLSINCFKRGLKNE